MSKYSLLLEKTVQLILRKTGLLTDKPLLSIKSCNCLEVPGYPKGGPAPIGDNPKGQGLGRRPKRHGSDRSNDKMLYKCFIYADTNTQANLTNA